MRLIVCLLLSAALLSADNWPNFRGPTRQGVSEAKNLPLEWGPGKNILWTASIPGLGWSSPIVWENRIFLTTATDEGATARVLALDADTGKILWNKEIFKQKTGLKRKQNSHATPTPVTDGKRVYAVFPGGAAALDFDGSIVWTNRDHEFESEHGLGASPVLWKDLLIMPYDGTDAEDERIGWKVPWDGAKLAAYDISDGSVRYIAKRGKSRIAHVTPNFMEVDGKTQMISGAGDVIQGFDPDTGERLWSVYSQGEGVVPSVVIGDGLAYTASGFEATTLRAVRPGGEIVWEQTRSVSHIPSFVYAEPYLYNLHEQGVLSALDAKTGDVVWQDRVGGNHWASPLYADGRIYFLSEDCESAVIEPGDAYKEIARNKLEGHCQASIAPADGRLYIRSADKLYAIGQ